MLSESESASFWISVVTDLKARGVEDILIACTDSLKGFTDGHYMGLPANQDPALFRPSDPL